MYISMYVMYMHMYILYIHVNSLEVDDVENLLSDYNHIKAF